ncbi:MAG: hypothetical protein V3V84_07410 [Candidatus Bathyarchaeia archaeon]
MMVYTLFSHAVEDIAKWKAIFDGATELRRSSGEISAQAFQDADNPKNVMVLNEWTTIEKAKEFINNPLLAQKMQEGGVLEKPSITFLNKL